ncbi:SepM family pheromone-processing serine protease [Aneurinibacillus sp. UBA3580]|jgi:PDZ domain-containing protein|uniref:SepM family pheromone-processing serine protease n=1 Tax=Aneurinibacillus sp. UBA3580 TaxID=1946041 RepID=UPI0025797289|nr:SepM family pheromone-processing serine protease [Aneurinibacillus sp. UBA3580]
MIGRRRFLGGRFAPFIAAVLAAVVILAVVLYPTDYYIIRPGSAIELQPMVTVEGGQKDEKGMLMLTTVRMSKANVLGYLYAKTDPYADLVKETTVHSPHETDEQYNLRELQEMKNSQQNAMIAAFRKAGLPVKVNEQGALVVFLVSDMPAKQYLKIGDVITKVDDREIKNAAQLLAVLKGRKAGETVKLTFIRDGQAKTADIRLKAFPKTPGQKETRAGIGIAYPNPDGPTTKRDIELPKKVTIQSENIGGPSAGMMFTLEIFNQLTPGDLTKGYRIAGTGTINADGRVGPIGGVKHKVRASDKMEADIFFAPDNPTPAGSKQRSNYADAKAEAEKLGTKMKIVPVRTLDDAIKYLESLPPKGGK